MALQLKKITFYTQLEVITRADLPWSYRKVWGVPSEEDATIISTNGAVFGSSAQLIGTISYRA